MKPRPLKLNRRKPGVKISSVQPVERVIIIGVGLKTESADTVKESLAELEDLCFSAGAEVVGTLTQSLVKYHPATLIGSGKIQEVIDLAKEAEASFVILDHQLSGIQSRNLEKAIQLKVLDRSQLILDIFAQRAQTYEGQLQVELAQMLDQLPRMVGAWQGSLSRQGGGIGARGPGETALEMDRRRIGERVKIIKKKLSEVSQHRKQYRTKRKNSNVSTFALMGYTNTGKSTLHNLLTQSNVLSKDQVFATLDPTTRKVFLPDMGPAILTDTVGFIRKLPTQFIEAFKSTLEESGEADVLLHIIDLSSKQMETQVEVVHRIINELGWGDKPIIYVFNKIDIAPLENKFQVKAHPRVYISAKTGEGIHELKTMMKENIREKSKEVELFFPKSEEFRIFELNHESHIVRKEPASQGTVCYVKLNSSQITKWKDYLV